MVGFRFNIVFDNNGKITSYQKNYHEEYNKIINVYLPQHINNKKNHFKTVLQTAINNTYPVQVEEVEGIPSETDINCYTFDVTNLYLLAAKRKLGLCKVKVIDTNKNRTKFSSENFRL